MGPARSRRPAPRRTTSRLSPGRRWPRSPSRLARPRLPDPNAVRWSNAGDAAGPTGPHPDGRYASVGQPGAVQRAPPVRHGPARPAAGERTTSPRRAPRACSVGRRRDPTVPEGAGRHADSPRPGRHRRRGPAEGCVRRTGYGVTPRPGHPPPHEPHREWRPRRSPPDVRAAERARRPGGGEWRYGRVLGSWRALPQLAAPAQRAHPVRRGHAAATSRTPPPAVGRRRPTAPARGRTDAPSRGAHSSQWARAGCGPNHRGHREQTRLTGGPPPPNRSAAPAPRRRRRPTAGGTGRWWAGASAGRRNDGPARWGTSRPARPGPARRPAVARPPRRDAPRLAGAPRPPRSRRGPNGTGAQWAPAAHLRHPAKSRPETAARLVPVRPIHPAPLGPGDPPTPVRPIRPAPPRPGDPPAATRRRPARAPTRLPNSGRASPPVAMWAGQPPAEEWARPAGPAGRPGRPRRIGPRPARAAARR